MDRRYVGLDDLENELDLKEPDAGEPVHRCIRNEPG